jgi:3-hydroxymyristoyl/3-hydroxydecanoyl-(acyl carrier protein) dehydratase
VTSPLRPVSEVLPQRPPFLFVDEVLEVTPARVVAARLFRPDEDFFKGHFPGQPVVPGVLLVEGLAQTLAYGALVTGASPKLLLVGIDRVRFKGVVLPSQRVVYEVEPGEPRMGLLKGRGRVLCDGKVVAEAELTGYHPDPE